MTAPAPLFARPIQVVELNPYAPRPFVFTEAAICLTDSIRGAGYAVSHVANAVDPGTLAIVMGAAPALAPGLALDPRTTAVFNFEQLGGNSAVGTPAYRRWLRDRLVLDYHSSNIDFLKRENGPRQLAFEVPLVPSPSLAQPLGEAVEKTVDVLFFGTPSARRDAVLDALRAAGATVEVVAGAYANELAPAVQRARLVLHVHYYESALFPVVRFLQPVARGVPIVCESPVFSRLSDWRDSGAVFAPYDQLAAACVALLQAPAQQQARAERALAFARHLDFATPFHAVARAWLARLATAQPPAPVAPPVAARPPVASPAPLPAPAASPAATEAPAVTPPNLKSSLSPEDEDRLLSNSEIEAILAQEAAELPEAHLQPAEPSIVKREPGQGRFGRWVAWLLVLFSLLTILQAMRR